MMRLVYPWIRIQAGIDHDPVDKVIDHRGDAVDTAEPLVKAGTILISHWSLLLLSKAGESRHYSIGRGPSLPHGHVMQTDRLWTTIFRFWS